MGENKSQDNKTSIYKTVKKLGAAVANSILVIMESKEDDTFNERIFTESSMNIAALNNLVVSIRPLFKRVKAHVIGRLVRRMKTCTRNKEEEKHSVAKQKKIKTTLEEISSIKMLNPDYAIKFSFSNELSFEKIAAKGNVQERALGRIATHPAMQQKIQQWRNNHEDWKSLAAFMLSKNTGRRFKKKKNSTVSLSKEHKGKAANKKDNRTDTLLQKKRHSSGTWTVTTHDSMDLSNSVNNDDSRSELFDTDRDIRIRTLYSDKTKTSNNNKSVKKPAIKSIVETDGKNPEKTRPKIESQNSNSVQSGNKAEHVPKINGEMVVTRLCLNNFSSEDDVLISGKTEDKLTSFLFESKRSRKEGKKDTFFLNSDSESLESSGEESDDVADDQGGVDVTSQYEESTIPRKTIKSTFLETLSSEDVKWKSDTFENKEGKLNRERRSGHQSQQRIRHTEISPGLNTKEKTTSASPRSNGGRKVITNEQNSEKLHPSWEASRKRKQQMSTIVEFKGKKITFDDD